MGQIERLERAVLALQEAQLDDSRWPVASARVDDLCGLDGNHLSVIRSQHGGDPQLLFGKLYKRGEPDEELERLYVENYLAIDERMPRFFRLPDSTLKHVSAMYTERELATSPTYNEFVVPTGAANCLNAKMDGPDGLHIIWTLVHSGDPSSWAGDDLRAIRLILPHIRHFVRVRQALADAGTGALYSASAALAARGIGVALLDWQGRIVETNDRMRALLRARDGLTDCRGCLVPLHKTDADRLDRLVSTATRRPIIEPQGGTMTVRRPGRSPLALYVAPLVPGLTATIPTLGRCAVVVFVVDPLDKPRVNADRLAQALDLTPAQARVAAAISSGETVRSVAEASRRSEAAVRFHLKQIMRRLGLAGQTDMVRLVLTTPGVFDDP